MFKIAKSVLMVAVISFVAIGATRSYFTDTETIASNNITSGTLDMTIGNDSSTPMSLDNIKPGDVITEVVNIENAGSLDFGSLKMSLITTDDPSSLLNQLQINTSLLSMQNPGIEIHGAASDITDSELLSEGQSIAPGSPVAVILTITVPEDLGNEYQSVGASFDLVFNAEQVK